MDYLEISRCFAILYRQSQNYIVDACRGLPLTYSEYVLLMRVADNEGESQEQLSAFLCIDKAVVTRTMKTLEEKKLIYRQQTAADRRIKQIYLTAYGNEKLPFLRKVLVQWADYLIEGMEPTEVEQTVQLFETLAHRSREARFMQLEKSLRNQ